MTRPKWPHEFRGKSHQQAAEQMLAEMQAGPATTKTLISIGQSWGLYAGQAQGVIGQLRINGKIENVRHGLWQLKADQ